MDRINNLLTKAAYKSGGNQNKQAGFIQRLIAQKEQKGDDTFRIGKMLKKNRISGWIKSKYGEKPKEPEPEDREPTPEEKLENIQEQIKSITSQINFLKSPDYKKNYKKGTKTLSYKDYLQMYEDSLESLKKSEVRVKNEIKELQGKTKNPEDNLKKHYGKEHIKVIEDKVKMLDRYKNDFNKWKNAKNAEKMKVVETIKELSKLTKTDILKELDPRIGKFYKKNT